jgi:hypothetical protein
VTEQGILQQPPYIGLIDDKIGEKKADRGTKTNAHRIR